MRDIFLKVHLVLGLVAAAFLLILSVTGTMMAFEHDIERWIDPALWRASVAEHQLTEDVLVAAVQAQFAPAHVVSIQVSPRADVVHVMRMSDQASVYVDQWSGRVTRRVVGTTRAQDWIGYVHQLHLRLLPNPRALPRWVSTSGKLVVSWAGVLLCLLVPTGLVLWWRAKRASVRLGGSWFRTAFDAHHAIGIYACVFLFVAAFTGVMVGFDAAERQIYRLSGSEEPNRAKPPAASNANGRPRIPLEQAIAAARGIVPSEAVVAVVIPDNSNGVYIVQLRSPREVAVDSPIPITVYVDPYSADVIRVQDLFKESPGYRFVRLNRAIHTGDFFGAAGHVVTSASSLALGLMVLSGIGVWRSKASAT
ncbi:MAG TPA: PepSY-associated TM helix domain-containing protein [Vicinamibacterales bacterium]